MKLDEVRTVTYECGHSTTTKILSSNAGSYKPGLSGVCWEWGCLQFRQVVEIEGGKS